MLASEFKRCTRVCNTHPVKRIKEAEAVEAGEDEVEEQPRSNNGKREGANVYWDSCIESLIGFSKPKYQHPPPPHLQKKKITHQALYHRSQDWPTTGEPAPLYHPQWVPVCGFHCAQCL